MKAFKCNTCGHVIHAKRGVTTDSEAENFMRTHIARHKRDYYEIDQAGQEIK